MTSQAPPAVILRRVLAEARRVTVLTRQSAAGLLAEHGLTIAGRSLLEMLEPDGSAAVPDLARSLLMSRQAVQRLVDDLRQDGFVRRVENPRHARRPLYAVTPRGREALDAVLAAEEPVLAGIAAGLDPAELEAVADTLSAVADGLLRGVPEEVSGSV